MQAKMVKGKGVTNSIIKGKHGLEGKRLVMFLFNINGENRTNIPWFNNPIGKICSTWAWGLSFNCVILTAEPAFLLT